MIGYLKHERKVFVLALAVLASVAVSAQTSAPSVPQQLQPVAPAKVITYDIVSIKRSKPGGIGNAMRNMPDGFIWSNCLLESMIGGIYGNRPDLISGLPGWASSVHYDVQAKVAPEDMETYNKLHGRERTRMSQQFLEDYFKLKAHIETKEMPIYELVIAKGGPKLQEASTADTVDAIKLPDGTPVKGFGSWMGRGQLGGHQVPVSFLLSALTGATGRSVVDKTGLTGKYDVILKWNPDPENASADAPPGIFTALEEQLGLKLQSAKGPVKSLVVDHVEQPAEN